MLYKRILLPIDGSPLASLAARSGIELAKELGAETMGIYVAQEFKFLMYGDMFPMDYLKEEEYIALETNAGENHLQEVKDAASSAGVNFSGLVVFSNSPAKEIVETAEKEGCDLIFMGSHGRSGAGQLLLGSVTSKVLSSCQIPVLVFRAKKTS